MPPRLLKLVVFVPEEAEEKVRMALGEAGAGRIGDYDHCCFVSRGSGHFRPLPGARPYCGQVGRIEDVAEVRIETVCEEALMPAVLTALRRSHPYEEIAYHVVDLSNHEFAHLVPRLEPR